MSNKRFRRSLLNKAFFLLAVVAALFLTPGADAAGDEKTGSAKKSLTVSSDRMEADNTSRIVVFKGNVEAVEDFLLCSDELRINYGKKDEISEIVATGKVRIFQEGKTAKSDKAIYDRVKRTLVLTGSPVVEQCADIVTGDKIIFYIDDDRALVEGSDGGRVRAVIMPDKKCSDGTPSGQGGFVKPGFSSGGKGSGEETRCRQAR